MGEKMLSLQDVREAIALKLVRGRDAGQASLKEWHAALVLHLTQPAQAVDAEMIERARNRYRFVCGLNDECEDDTIAWKEALTAAIPNANGKEG